MAIRDLFGALREREFRLVFLARASSIVGDEVAPIALVFAILDLTHGSASALGAVLAARTAPFVIFLLVGGVWADRLPRQRVMLASDLGRCVTQGATAFLLISGTAHVWEIAALQAFNGVAGAFFEPAATGLTPQAVSPGRLQQANALFSLTGNTMGIGGPAIAALLIATVGSGWALAVDALSFAASAAFLARVRVPELREPGEHASFVSELVEGWREVTSRSWVWVSIVSFMLFQFLVLGTLYVLGPVVARRSLGGAPAWALIVGAMSAGALLGSLVGLRFQPRRPLLVGYLVSMGNAVPMIMLGLGLPAIAIAAACVVVGSAFSLPDTLWFTALQEHVPQGALSRVSSYDHLGSTVLRPIGYAIVGPVAAAIGVRATMIGAAVLMIAMELVVVSLPSIRGLTRVTAPEVEPAHRS